MEKRIPATEKTVEKLIEIGKKATALIAEVQMLELEANQTLQAEALELGLDLEKTAFDFANREYIIIEDAAQGEAETR